MVDTFEEVNGAHPGFRRNHAKGVCVRGYFEGNGQGSSLSRAVVFRLGKVPVIGRFALAGSEPYAGDAAATVRSMALLFRLPNGEEWRTGMNNIPVFPFRTAQEFRGQLLASAPDPTTGTPDPAKMEAFSKQYPESARAFGLIRNRSASPGFEEDTFNSLNAFRFVNADGVASYVRWSMVPTQRSEPTTTVALAPTGSNYLFDALIASIHRRPLQWHLMVTIAQPGDATDDATVPWPPDRRQVDVGTLTIDQIESEDVSPARDINFDPLVLPDGMAASDDPLLSARSAAYSQSFTRREGETKSPSAISSAETGR